jgi:SIR2-like domain
MFLNLTLFLGAGFSAPFGHPTMDTFFAFADACDRLDKDDRSFLGRLILEARRANSFFESSPTNLEDILSFSEMGDRLQLTDMDENRNLLLRTIVRKIYTTTPEAAKYWPRYKALTGLLGKEISEIKKGLSFITTNYDLNIESACYNLRARVDPGFNLCRPEIANLQVAGSLYQAGGIPLFKLHGSVNWYPIEEEPGISVEDRVVRANWFGEEGGPPTLPLPCFNEYTPPAEPMIIPPSFLKPDLSSALKAVWQGAAKVLSTASVVVFVGYSFPPSDTEMMFFLARALSENAGLRAVYIVDKNANAITARLRSAGSKIGSHFRDLIRPINSDWTEANLPLVNPPL